MLEHGGGVNAAAEHYGIPAPRWLDLSTGVNPLGWPVPAVPPEAWRRLPEEGDGLLAAARAYYGCDHLLPVAGSQAAIQALPWLRAPCRVGLVGPAYAEHERAWWAAEHDVSLLDDSEVEGVLAELDVLVVVNPNNPTGRRIGSERLLAWAAVLGSRGGWLVVDEAFMDATPQEALPAGPGRVVLRSLGKFFGLAGLRVGFVCAPVDLLDNLAERLGPWAVSGPARWVATRALEDRAWQGCERRRLAEASRRLAGLLAAHGLKPAGGTALFQYVPTLRARPLQEALAREAILVRAFDEPPALRFGLPGEEDEWQRLEEALGRVVA